MRRFPVGRLSANQQNHLGVIINRVMTDVLQLFLEKWQGEYRHWGEYQSNPRLTPQWRQAEYLPLTEGSIYVLPYKEKDEKEKPHERPIEERA
jgi:hypothetical protein